MSNDVYMCLHAACMCMQAGTIIRSVCISDGELHPLEKSSKGVTEIIRWMDLWWSSSADGDQAVFSTEIRRYGGML